jgi:diguanylate cyclase (GGDEF)-like protein/PAS domain S-box-containing protein
MGTSETKLLDEPPIGGLVAAMREVTERRHDETALQLSEARYRNLFEHAADLIFTADLAGNVTSANPAAEQITGYTVEELLGMNFFDVVAPEERGILEGVLARRMAGGPENNPELQLIAKGGRPVFVSVTGRVVHEGGHPVRIEGIVRDTTERHVLEERLRHQAFHDALTGLPNRALLRDRVDLALARGTRTKSQVAVLLLDVDDFKLINDSLGHAAGDEMLVELAGRLQSILRSSETVARMGGDEFVIVAEGVLTRNEAVALGERILSVFAEPFTVTGMKRKVTASLGIALSRRGAQANDLLRDADTAMYRVKATNKGGVEVFESALRGKLLRQIALTKGLDEALRDGKLEVNYQPIVSLQSGRILAVEALARWRHPHWGWIQPDEFIPIAEQSGMIVALGRHVLGETAREMARWRKESPTALPLGVFVNVSPHELSQRDFVSFVSQTLAAHGLAVSDLALELTEHIVIDERNEVILGTLAELARLGMRLIIDDFGTGYSALSSLRRFPFSALKIDRYFIEEIDAPDAHAPIIRALVGLGKALHMMVIAEGVETQVQHDYLASLGCDAAQGFGLRRPKTASAISVLLGAEPDLGAPARSALAFNTDGKWMASGGTSAPIPSDDAERLSALWGLNVLDTGPEREFDEIARLAAEICETPMSFVSLVDRDREYFKAAINSDVCESPRSTSFCGHAILEQGVFVVPDALDDPRFADNPDVIAGPRVRFYAGAPLVTHDGYAIGMLCVKDTKPRDLTWTQRHALEVLGRQAAAQFELRRLLAQTSTATPGLKGPDVAR